MEKQMDEPFVRLLADIGAGLGVEVLTIGEISPRTVGIRPDFRVDVAGALIGYVELKRPGTPIPTTGTLSNSDRAQWEKLQLLPNVLYGNGEEWALFRYGQLTGRVTQLSRDLAKAGIMLSAADDEFTRMVSDFLLWKPYPPRTVNQMVRTVAKLCRLLRSEVTEALARERSGKETEPIFSKLAADWRALLFPELSDQDFADAYSQTVTFALLLARADGIDFEGKQLLEIATGLNEQHPLIGKALVVLTEEAVEKSVVVTTLLRVIGVIDWDQLSNGGADTYPHLYERFLGEYDQDLRMRTGSYYTPDEVVSFMVRFVEKILRSKMGRPWGLASEDVVITDPVMGTGTFLVRIIDSVAATITAEEGRATVPPRLRALFGRLIGFEKQTGPYAVAELRIHQALKAEHATEVPDSEVKLYLADAFDDPYAEQSNVPHTFDLIARSRREACNINRDQPVFLVIGNPPWNAQAKGKGGWIEQGGSNSDLGIPMGRFRAEGNARLEYVLLDSYVYFWRWATWKVFDAHPAQPSGIVAFITPSSYTTRQGYAGMREYLRRTADEGWIVNLSPEGHQPDVSTRIFPGVQQPLCIGVFVRYGSGDPDHPAQIHHLSIGGHRTEKLARLEHLQLDDPDWADCGTGWRDRFTSAEDAAWTSYPVLGDLFPWHASGVQPGRTWVYSPDADILKRRWDLLVAAPPEEKPELFKESRDRTIDAVVQRLPGFAGHEGSIRDETGTCPPPVRAGYRSFDRQWIIPDNRLYHRSSPDLWRVRGSKQIYAVTQHARPLTAGPGVIFSPWIPDMDHFMGHHGGQVLPLYRDAAGQIPNVASGLRETIADRLQIAVPTAEDLLAYVACVVAHSGYTTRFGAELANPGVRVPLTADPALWAEAVAIGRQLVWLHSYGEQFVDRSAGRPSGSPRLPSGQHPTIIQAILDEPGMMPENISYDPDTETLHVGEGQIRPVPPQVWEYEVSGMKIVKKWLDYRKENRSGRRSSPLDAVVPDRWPSEFTTELLELLNVLGRCVKLELAQDDILDRICQHPVITIADLTQAKVLPCKYSARKPIPPDEQSTPGRAAASIDTAHADRANKLAEQADEIRRLVAARDYRQVKEWLMRLATEDPQQAEPLLQELGFIALPDPDRQIVGTAWSAIAVGRAVQSLLAKYGTSPAHGLLETAGAATPPVAGPTGSVQPQMPAVSAPRRSSQQPGALLEQAAVNLFARFFTVEPDTILGRLRRQGGGAQFGHDIEAEWTVAGSPAVRCHVECKNLDRRVTVDDIAGKLAQQKYHHRGIQIDHWILISPHHDGANELPGMLEAWAQQGEYPFSVQVWSPETRVHEMFALEPAVYEAIYGRPPTQEEISASDEVADLIRQKLAPRLRVDAVWRRYLERPSAFCFVNEDSHHFDGLYSRHLWLGAADDRGALLDGTLMDQVIGWSRNDAAPPLLLLADFGEGKSVFTYCLMRRLSEEFRATPDGALFPLRIPLREFREAGSARGLLQRRLAEIGATLADWRAVTKQVRTLVVLDGFDEMSADLSPAAITANLRDARLCLTEFSGSKVLVTSRQRVLDGSRDWKRTMDRLGHPQIMRIVSGPRGQRVQYLEQFATDDASVRVLASLRNLYDPIGLAAKPLFLEMIKETLRDLPDDTFSETILYDTYINKSLRTKWELLADPGDELTSDELIENVMEILEDVAVRLQETNGAYLYLRDYEEKDRGKIAERLWEMRDQPVPREPFPLAAQDDAANRLGIRSLLKAVPAPNAERWPVDFFHRSIREYFVARSIVRSLTTDERQARRILSAAPLLPEIAHFAVTILRSRQDDAAPIALERMARSATIDGDDAYTGGNAFTLLHGAGGPLAERDWSRLYLDHARLRGADLHRARFAGSSLRYANLDNANLEDADLTEADLEGVRLEETSRVLAVTGLNGNRVIAAYEDLSLRKWHRHPGAGWESQVVATLDHKADQLQVTPMGRVLASGEGMLSVLDLARDTDGSSNSAELDRSSGANEAGEASKIRCAFRTSSRCQAAVLGARTALFTEEGDAGRLLVAWLDMINARVLAELDVDETVTACTQLDEALFALATPNTVQVVSLLGGDGCKEITVADPAVTCLSVRVDSDHVLLAAGHHDGSVSLTQLGHADTGVVAPQWTRHLHDGPVTDIFLDTEERVITGSTDRRIYVTPVSAVRSDRVAPDTAEFAVQALHLTLRCKGVRFDGVRTEREQEKLRRYAES
jgi:Type ISP C-terminal specificity domain/N-6 DNA Methylase/Pentapeptide repeats (8 copies)/NACHT domain